MDENVNYRDRSSTITVGGTAQSLMPANPTRRGWCIDNLSAGDLWFSEVGTATAASPSRRLASGERYEPPAFGISSQAISIIGATTSQAFAAREW